ncbi:MAG: response regulator [Myxococcota bacterium]|nr:response regulator [Myxococcota bacterium]
MQRTLNILLVEDDEVDVLLVKRAFAEARVTNTLDVVSDGIAALAYLRSPDTRNDRRIVLLDLNMPRMSGLEFLRELRADEQLKHTTVIVMTTSNEDKDRIEAYDLNVSGYVVKPLTFAAFAETVAALNKYWTLMEL